jgi:Protein of unknown function (DUF2878)
VKALLNFAAYQVVWFVAVIGAGRGLYWPALVAASAFIAWELLPPGDRRIRIQLLVVALVCGAVVDGSLAVMGRLHYATASPALLPGGAPLWILALWAAFSQTITQSMKWLLGRTWLAALFGLIGAPLAYLGAERGWSAVNVAVPVWQGVLSVGIGWAIAMALIIHLATRWLPRRVA